MTDSTLSNTQELREQLAAIEHERWADWQKWCHKVLRENSPSPETLKVLERWDKQIATPYSALSRKEQESDLEQVDRYWPLISSYTKQARKKLIEDIKTVGYGYDDGTGFMLNISFAELAALEQGANNG